MKIAVATPPYPKSVNDGLSWVSKLSKDAAADGAEIICFPESYLPGYPIAGYKREQCTTEVLKDALDKVCKIAAKNELAIIIPMDWHYGNSFYNVAHVISAKGEIAGFQSKNQLDPTEDLLWAAGTDRKIFEVNGVKFGITICHEGFRYPESVRWAAARDARIVFHPNFTGSDVEGPTLTEWRSKEIPFFESAQMMRALENTVYIATSNYALRYPQSASSIIGPDGQCIAHQDYGKIGVLTVEIDPEEATGLLAKRFHIEQYK